jgi:DNA polymerase III sliding clamp (beta) subunit (PCNA family)
MNTVLTETSTKTQYLMPLNTAKSVASLAVFAGKDKFTPALTLVKVVFNGYGIAATATDRYGVVFANLANDETNTGTIYLDAAACKFITGTKVAKGYNAPIMFELDGENLTITVLGASITIKQYTGTYPDTASLLTNFKYAETATPVSLKIDLLAKLGKIANVDGAKIEAWNFWLGEPSVGYNGKNRPAPVIAKKGSFTALIQPMLGLQD